MKKASITFKNIKLNLPPFNELQNKMIIDALNTFTGFSGYGGLSPYLKPIKIIHFDYVNKKSTCEEVIEDESKFTEEVDFFKLFYSYPPFEPLPWPHVKYNDLTLIGNRIWFLKVKELKLSKDLRNCFGRILRRLERYHCLDQTFNVNNLLVFFGEYEEYGNKILLKKIITCRIVGDYGYAVSIRFDTGGYGSFRINYGLPFLQEYLPKKDIRPFNINKNTLYNVIRKALGKQEPRYRPEVLNYITWCYNGRVISTDPIAPGRECDACNQIGRGLCSDVPGYGRYHYSRTIFPKVNVDIINSIEFKPEVPQVPFEASIISNVKMTSEVKELTLNFPAGNLLRLTPTKRPFTVLRRTNGLLLTVSELFIRALIHFMEHYEVYLNDNLNKSFNLLHLLATKYVVYKDPFNVLSDVRLEVDNQCKIGYKKCKLVEEVNKFFSKKLQYSDDFVSFVGETLMHTLAHVLLMMVSEELDLNIEDLAYVYGSKDIEVDSLPQKVFYLAILEKNDCGTLQLDVELNRRFGSEESLLKSLSKKLFKFVCEDSNSIIKMIEEYKDKYELTIKEFKERLHYEICGNKLIGEFVEFVKKHFLYYLLENNVLPDFDILKNFIINAVNNNKPQIAKALNTSVEELEELIEKYLDDIVMYLMDGIHPCIDGCCLDIHLEKLCSKALFENLLTSRNLLILFLKVSGILSEGLETDSEGMFKLVTAAKKEVYIKTSFTSTQALLALSNLLSKGVKVKLELDCRRINQFRHVLEQLKNKYPASFSYNATDVPDHGKSLKIDRLKITTSWNYGTSSMPRQNYVASLQY